MPVRRPRIARAALITTAILAGVLLLYVGSFFFIRHSLTREWFYEHDILWYAHNTAYLPLRWLAARGPACLPWRRSTITLHGEIVPGSGPRMLTMRVDGQLVDLFGDTGPGSPPNPGDLVTVHVQPVLIQDLSGATVTDLVGAYILRLDRRSAP